MKALAAFTILMTVLGLPHAAAAAGDVAPGGTLRAAFLMTNPAQAVRDPATGAASSR